MTSLYSKHFTSSVKDASRFWTSQALSRLSFPHASPSLGDPSRLSWADLSKERFSLSYNAWDRFVEAGEGDRIAMKGYSCYGGSSLADHRWQEWTVSQTLDEVDRLARGLLALGVTKGDRVIIYMPNIAEAVFAMHAVARIGAIHSVVFGGFSAKELGKRIADAQPAAILTASCGLEPGGRIVPYTELVGHALELAHARCPVAVFDRGVGDATAGLAATLRVPWPRADDDVASVADSLCTDLRFNDPLYILYTSGTTGAPKGVVRTAGPHATALHYSMDAVYDTRDGDTFFASSDIGWVVGHSYIAYAPQLRGVASVVFEGKPVGTPDTTTLPRVIQQFGVSTFFAAPTAVRAIKKADPDGVGFTGADLSTLRSIFLAGERTDPATIHWLHRLFPSLPVVDHWWATETGSPISAVCLGLGDRETKVGSGGKPVPGFDVRVVDAEHGTEVTRGTEGSLVIKLLNDFGVPPGTMQSLWQDETRYRRYLDEVPGYLTTGDTGHMDDDGYITVTGRAADMLKVAGHLLSTGDIEAAVSSHASVAECAVVGEHDELKGEMPIALVVLKDNATEPTFAELNGLVREQVGPIASLGRSVTVSRLPKTRSGKILRRSLKQIVAGQVPEEPATIEDPAVLHELSEMFSK
jgi:propionyl-CoA synthetase